MSWFDRAVANAGVDKRDDYGQQAIEKELAAKQEQANYDTAWNYLSHGDIAGFSDYSNRNLNYRDIPFLGQFVGHAADATTQGIADAAQFVGAEGVGDYLNVAAKRGEERLPPMTKPELSLNYITDPNGLTSAFGSVVGSMLPIGAAAYLAPVGGLTAAAANVASKAPLVGGFLEQTVPHAIRWGLTGPVEAAMEAGGGERDMREQGMSKEEARQKAWEVFGKNAALLAATNAIGGAALPHIFKGVTKAAQNGSRLAGVGRFAGATGTEVGINALEEGEQQGIQNSVMGKPYSYNPANWSEDQKEAAAFGVAGTAPFALFGLPATIRNMRRGTNPVQNDSLENAEALLTSTPKSLTEMAREYSQQDVQNLLNQLMANDYNQQEQFNQAVPQAQSAPENSLDGFDANFVSKWESKPGATDLANVQPSVKNAFNAAIAEYGDSVTITGGAEKGYHATGEAGHEGGWKIDVDKASVKNPEKFLRLMAKYGFKVGDEGDHYDLSGHAKGGVGGTVVATPDNFISNGNQQTNATTDLSRFNDKQREAWNEALWVQQQTGIPADYIYRQWAHESGNFTSRLARENNNFGGLTQTTPNGEENKQPDGGNYYRMYNNMHEYAESYVKDFINRYDGKENIKSMADFVNFLHSNGYFTADPKEYLASMQGIDAPTGGSSSYTSSNTDITIPNSVNEQDTTNSVLQSAMGEYGKIASEQNQIDFAGEEKEEPTDRELIQEAKEKAQDSGDMDKLQDIIKAERSGDKEHLSKIIQQVRATKATPKTPQIKVSNKNLVGIVRKLVSQAKSEGIHIGDELVEKVINSGDEAQLKNYVGLLQTQIKLNGFEARKEKGNALIKQALDNNVHLPVDVYENLRKGMPHAIKAAQSLIAKAEQPQKPAPSMEQTPVEQTSTPTSTQVQTELPVTAQPENTAKSVQAESAPKQPVTLQDRVNQVRGNEQGTPVSGVKVSELASIINSAGQPTVSNKEQVQEQATRTYPMGEESYKQALATYNGWPQNMLAMAGQQTLEDMQKEGMSVDENLAKELKDGNKESIAYAGELLASYRHDKWKKAEIPGEEQAKVPSKVDDNDYHGFFDGKKPGAVKEAKKRLEEKINPFGAAEGFRTVKSIMERWAETDESNQSSNKGKSYYVHGNKVNKAAYDYYNHLVSNVYGKTEEKQPADTSKAMLDRVMEGYRTGKKTLEDATVEIKHYRDRWKGMVRGVSNPQQLQELNAAIKEADKDLEELSKATEPKAQDDGHMAWIKSHPFKYDESLSVEKNIKRAEKLAQEYMDEYGSTDQINTPERQALRKKIADELYGDGAKQKNHEAFLIVGLPASGKSTISDPLVAEKGALLVDSDEAKKRLPEFSNGLLATAVHKESSNIAGEILDRALDNGDNIVMPVVGRTYENLQEKIDGLREDGYTVKLIYVDLPLDKAIERVKNRFQEEGRLVSPGYLKSVGLKPKENYDKIKVQEGVDSYEAWNNDVPRGDKPLLIESSDRSEQPQTESGMGRQRDNGRRVGPADENQTNEKRKSSNDEVTDHSSQGGLSATQERIFGDKKTAYNDMLEALGINDETIEVIHGVDNTTEEELERLEKEFAAELSKLNANPVFNPKIYTLGLKIAMVYLRNGYNTFKKLVAQLNAKFGKDVEPWSESIAETVRTWPKGVPFNEKQVMAVSKAVGAAYEDGATSLEDVQAEMKKLLKGNYKQFAPMIEASYNGISKFFENRGGNENAESSRPVNADKGRAGDKGERSEGAEEVSARSGNGRESIPERPRTSEGANRGLETSPSENGQEISENGNPEGVRAGVPGETGRRSGESDGRSYGHGGRESGREPISSSVGRGGRQSGGEGSQGSSGMGGVREETSRPVNYENYHIEDMNALFGGTPKVRFARNKKAIEVFQDLQATRRYPTQEDKDAMAAFTGWGSFGQQLFQGTYENPKPAEGWEKESEWLRDTLGKEDWESAKNSIINAHYTAPVVVKSMWDMIRRMGFKGGRVLEPSMGVGNFFGMMPKDMEEGSTLFGVEMDTTTGGMAQLLYPKANIQIKPYQDVHVADGTYDLIVGNVPFGDIAPADRRYDKYRANLHDYFFLKGIDELRNGGIMIAITSKGSMDKMNRSVRMELAKKAELVDAYRFPTGAFGEYAGTDVVTDVLVFKKREQPIMDVTGEEWINTTEHTSDVYDRNTGDYYKYRVNNFFENHPEKVLGTMGFGRTTGKRPGLMVTMDKENFQKQLDGMVKSIAKDTYEEAHYDKNLQYVSNNENDRLGTLQEVDGKLYVATGVDSKPIEAFKEWSLGSNVTSAKTINARLEELKDLVKLRKAYAKLEDAEKKDSPDMEKLRKQLKAVYDAHVAKYCYDSKGKPLMVTYTTYDENNNKVKKKRPKILEDTAGLKLFKKADEPNYFSLCALQRKDGKPAKILTERVMRTSKKDIDNPTVQEALMIQRNQSMRIDVDEIAKMAKKPKAEVLKELQDYLFKTPNGDYQVADQYLSGNVRRKMREAKAAYANGDMDMKHNIDALQKVMPEDIPYYNINVGFGGTWIDIPYYKQFVAELVGTKNTDNIVITKNKNGAWQVKFEDKALNGTAGATMTYGTPDVKFDRLLTHALNHTKPTITRRDSDGNTYKDEEAMKKAVEQIDKIRETFGDWVWQDEKRKVALAHNYNEVMNNTAKPNYDGSFLDMNGMMLTKGDKEFDLRQHQINAIYRGLVNGSGIYAHEVGTGKTYTMGGLAMESRRFGIAKKPLILAHNANSQAVANEIQEMYPGAKVLYIAGDGKNVKKDLMRVKMDDWDVVVMPHSKTNMLTLTPETLDALSADIIAELEDDAIEAAKADGIDLAKYDIDDESSIKKIRSQTAKDLVKMRLKIKEQNRKYAYKASDEKAVPFEDLGIDMIIVDESHDYKKPPFSTRMTVKGLQKGTSGLSTQLSFLTQYVQGLNNGKGVHLFTGTPITNTVTEMYHNMKYVMPNEMKEAGVYNFDDWFNAFANVTSNMEYTSTGEVDNVDRLNAFVNVAELRRMVGQYMDIVFAEDMPEFKPRETASGKTLADKDLTEAERDYLINGRDENAVGRPYMQTINEVIPMNDAQKSILSMFMGYAKQWKQASKKERKQIMMDQLPQSPLFTESSTHKAAMDARMYNPNVNVSGMDSKESRVIKNVVDVYNMDKRTTQVIMMDQGKNDSAKQILRDEKGYPIGGRTDEGKFIKQEVETYNLQKGIIDGLIAQGIPEKEIAVVTGTTSPEKKAEIAQMVKHGEIRVVIGSTATLGTGVNMQDNLKAIHHVDAPWMPGDLEQRNGRILRQGNKWNTVLEYRYITEKLDGRRWQVLSTKKKFIKMFMKADDDLRVLDGDAVDVSSEEEGSGSDFEETLSKATGDPRFLRKANLEETVKKLEKSKAAFVSGIENAKYKLEQLQEGGLDELKYNVNTLKSIQDKYGQYKQSHDKDNFEITIDGKRYTERKDADLAISEAFRKSDKIDKEFKLGEFAGLNLYGIKQRNTDFAGSYTNRIRITDGTKTVPGFDSADSVAGITQKLSKVGSSIDREQAKLDMAESDIKTLEKQVKGTFPREAVLNAKHKELEALKQDLLDNPVPPPQWLVEGAPMQADVIVDGKHGEVAGYQVKGAEGFKQDEEGKLSKEVSYRDEDVSFYVGVKLDGSDEVKFYPWQDVKDSQGLPMITAPNGVKEAEALKDNQTKPTADKQESKEPTKEEKPEPVSDRIIVATVPPAGKSTANINVDEFKHTKTGKMIPAASLKDNVPKSFHKQATAIAKNHGGKWSPFAKRILFKTEQGRDDFVREAEAMLSVLQPETSGSIDVKFSIDGWHGSKHHFDKFSVTKIGTGEGAQVHGYGLYIAGDRKVAEGYRKKLAGTVKMPTFDEIVVDGQSLDDMLGDAIENGDYEKQAMLENYENYNRDGVLRSAKEDGFNQKYIDWFNRIADKVEKQLPEKPGALYHVEIPDSDVLLDKEKAFGEQESPVEEATYNILDSLSEKQLDDWLWARHRSIAKENSNATKDEKISLIFEHDLMVEDGGWNLYKGLADVIFSENGHSNPQKASEYLNKYGIKGLTYNGGLDGRCYVIFDDEAIDIIEKFSAEGEIQRAMENAVPVANEDLTSQERKISEFGKQMGTPILWVDANPKLHGYHAPNGTTVLNRRSNMNLSQTFWHETFHWITNNPMNGGISDELMDYFMGKITKKQIDDYVKRTGRTDLATDEDVIEEMLADAFDDVSQRVKIFKEMGVEQPSLAQKFVAWVKRMMDKFAEFFHNPEGRLTTSQRDSFVKAFGRLARDIVDSNGKPLFKVYKEGKEIRLPSGQPVVTALPKGDKSLKRQTKKDRLIYSSPGLDTATTSNGGSVSRPVSNDVGAEQGVLPASDKSNGSSTSIISQGKKTVTKNSDKAGGKTKFSYSASDNSNEGLWHRIKNIMSGRVDEDSAKFRYRKHLTEMLEKALDVKIRYGKMDGRSGVVYKESDKVLRSRHAYDWENILPVAGRIAAKKLGIESPSEEMCNYIADWILTGAPNNVSREANQFHKAMQNHIPEATRLQDLQDSFAEWMGKDYKEQMQGTIQWQNKQKPSMKERRERFYEEFVEELEPINRLVKQVNANLTAAGKEKLQTLVDPMIAFRMLRGSYGRAMTAMEGENEGAITALKHAFPNVDFTGFKTLHMILKEIDAFQNIEKQRDFITYCTACHIMDMHQHNDDIHQEQQHLKNKMEKLGDSKEDEAKKAELEAKIDALQDEIMPIPAAYTKANCEKYISDGYDKYNKAQQDLVHFSNTTAAMLADSGVISEKRYQELLNKWQNYVPLFRVFDDNEDINFGDSMKHIKGSMRDIVNPLESIIRNTAQFIQKAEQNKAKQLLADVARCDNSGWLIEEVDKSDGDKTTITFYENGKRKYLQTDPDIVKAVNHMNADSSHMFIKFLHAITRLARACFTMASPEFALRNVARDWGDATLYTKHGWWVNPLDIVRGFMHAFNRDEVYYEWLTQGAAQASALSLDRNYTQSTLDQMGRRYWQRLASKDFFSTLLEGLQKAGEYSEYGTRIAMYKKTKEALLKDNPNATKAEIQEAMLEAAFESRDLMDFARHGKAGAEYNKITAFANASIQGWDKLYRSLDFKNDPKRATRVAAKMILYGALPAMLIFLMYHDDDWYKDAPDWLKETHWLFKVGDTTVRIPKAADMGIRFISNAVEKGMDEAFNKRPHKAKEYFMPMWDALPNFAPTSILPIWEIQANKSFFTDRPIIPQSQEKLPAKLQYGPYTTSLAKWVGEKFDVAPRNVEHFISGYMGTLGMAIPKAVDLVSGQNQQSLSLEEMPLIRGYLYPQYKSPQSVNDFYKKLDEQTKLKNEYKITHKRPDNFNPALLQRLENAQKQLRKISKQEKSIIDNPKWTLKDREVMQRNIQKKRIEIAKKALGYQ